MGIAEYIEEVNADLHRQQTELIRQLAGQLQEDGVIDRAAPDEIREFMVDIGNLTRRDLAEFTEGRSTVRVPVGPFADHDDIRACFQRFRDAVDTELQAGVG